MSVTRAEGYRRSRASMVGDRGVDVVRSFVATLLDFRTEPVNDPNLNRWCGDLRVVTGGGPPAPQHFLEVKSQPISPERYQHNFVEVMEDLTLDANPRHDDGFRRTADILWLTPEELASAQVTFAWDHQSEPRPLGVLEYANASLESVAGSTFTVYVNPDPDMAWVAWYSRDRLLDAVAAAVTGGKMMRGAGNSNDCTLGVFVRYSPAMWVRTQHGWRFYLGPDRFAPPKEGPLDKIAAHLLRPPRPRSALPPRQDDRR